MAAEFLPDRHTVDCQNSPVIGLDKYTNGKTTPGSRQHSRRCANPSLEPEADSACTCSDITLGNRSAGRISDRYQDMLRGDVSSPDVIDPGVICLTNYGIDTRHTLIAVL